MYFQPDGGECIFLFVPWGLAFLFAIMASFGIAAAKLGLEKCDPSIRRLLMWWQIPLCWVPFAVFFIWFHASTTGVRETACVDELYYFDIQYIDTPKEKHVPVFYDNRGRFLYADDFLGGPADDNKVARKRVFRGRSWLLSWEWMEFDIVPK